MINKNLVIADIFNKEVLLYKATRDGFGTGLLVAGKENENVVVLCADLSESTKVEGFKKEFGKRYIEIGVAEQNLATVASGLASYGKIPFIASYATFSPGRNNEQIRTTISLNDVPVKIAGAHAGVSVGPDGATHQALEDVALMRVQPNMTVFVPADANEAHNATLEAVRINGPVYIRLGRSNTPVFIKKDAEFIAGKGKVLFDNDDIEVVIIGNGPILYNALVAANNLEEEGINVSVIDLSTVKPLDKDLILEYAKRAGAVVTVEEHQIAGGTGSAVAEFLAENFPVPIEFIGVRDSFGQSGTPEELFKHYAMDSDAIRNAVMNAISKK